MKAFGVALGTNRLPIVGERVGAQPKVSRNGRFVLAQNGEVYNYKALAQAVAGTNSGEPAQLSDTQVLADAIESFGVVEALRRADWEGAFVAIDTTRRELIIARDHIGVKPLYVAAPSEDRIAVASELKALVDARQGEVEEIAPGSVVTWSLGDLREKKVGRWPVPIVQRDGSPSASYVDEIDVKFRDAVASRVPDEPYAVLFSGGLDSSLVLEYARSINPAVTAYILFREGSPDLDVARRYCAESGVRLVEVEAPSPEAATALIPYVIRVVESWEWHVINHSVPMVPVFEQMARDGMRIVLTGEGADELFCGYREPAGTDPQQRRQDRVDNLHRTNCQRLDRISMSETIECRVPFLSQSVARAALEVPASAQRDDTTTKRFLRAVARRRLPSYIVDRPKLSLARGVGYEYGTAGIFARDAGSGDRDYTSEAARFQVRYPIEESMVGEFLKLGYGRRRGAEFATV
ncbi:asparagine synthetase B family protein [Leifsonia sp. McL0607]|uniref:asparagine synthetase B family protein n=1 Tax=Leifsonia sp. McL0607 TaxID=3415672 RepID=UPI003CF4089A